MSLFALLFCVAVAAPVEDDHSDDNSDAVFVGAVTAASAVGGGVVGAVWFNETNHPDAAIWGVYLGAAVAGGLAAGLATLAVRPAPDALLVGGVSTVSVVAAGVFGLLALPFVFTSGIAVDVVLLLAHGPALEPGPLIQLLSMTTWIVGAGAGVAVGAVGGLRAVDDWARSSGGHDLHHHRDGGEDDIDGDDVGDDVPDEAASTTATEVERARRQSAALSRDRHAER